MASPALQTATADPTNQTSAATGQQPAEELLDNDEVAVDTNTDADLAYAGSDGTYSETQSIASMYRGYMENGRRYESLSDSTYYQPTDEKQHESHSAAHMLFLILDSQRKNTLFQSPISPEAQNVIDLGTGSGEWALDVADRYPNLNVRAVDLSPPPSWTAPNCTFEVDDIGKDWTYNIKWDLVHMRLLFGAFPRAEFKALYKRAYDNLQPGGWIEQVEADIGVYSDDGSLPGDSLLASHLKTYFIPISERAGRPLDTFDWMRASIEEAGFVNVHQQDYKCPLGDWPRLQVYKDAGRVHKQHFLSALEGWVMYFLTNYGEPTPWSAEEVQVFVAKLRVEVESGWHIYQKARRVWAQKPFNKEETQAVQKPTIENVASASPSPKQPTKKQQKTEVANAAEGT